MKAVIVSLLLAVVFFLGAGVVWRQAQAVNSLADTHFRLATLQLGHTDALTAASDPAPTIGRQLFSPAAEERRARATATYWLKRYSDLKPWVESTGAVRRVDDPALLFAAANAAFRDTQYDTVDRKIAVERLDGVIQAYAGLLRMDSSNQDAAYNYEYVSRLRDQLASTTKARPKPSVSPYEDSSPDLPVGPTLHGQPGGPPADIKADDFKTLTPMRYDEREETNPGPGQPLKRKG